MMGVIYYIRPFMMGSNFLVDVFDGQNYKKIIILIRLPKKWLSSLHFEKALFTTA